LHVYSGRECVRACVRACSMYVYMHVYVYSMCVYMHVYVYSMCVYTCIHLPSGIKKSTPTWAEKTSGILGAVVERVGAWKREGDIGGCGGGGPPCLGGWDEGGECGWWGGGGLQCLGCGRAVGAALEV